MSSRRSGPTAPGAVYGGLAVALLAAVAVVAVTHQQPPPPTIAEFAPQAQERIEEAPEEQTSEFGAGDDGASLGEEAAAPPSHSEEEAAPIEVPRVRRCVGEPPRQIEDPQSPPCVPYWEGDNGGATYQGVTRDEIRVYAPRFAVTSRSFDGQVIAALERFFNLRFEFYGRQLRLIDSDAGNQHGAEEQQAWAVEADEEHQVFASTFYHWGGGIYYSRELARRGVVSTLANPEYFMDQRELARFGPYVWQYFMSTDRLLSTVGDWVCQRLAGRDAVHAGPGTEGLPREFGVVHSINTEDVLPVNLSLEHLLTELERCGAEPAIVIEDHEAEFSPSNSATLVLNLREAGVTSVICLCGFQPITYIQQAATQQTYFPEWIASTYGGLDVSAMVKLFSWDPQQMDRTFGLTFQPRQVQVTEEPYMWALGEVDPDTAGAPQHRDAERTWVTRGFYRSLLLIASGIQMAGPNLTPETFAAGLQGTVFPNPDHPIKAGAVGFQQGPHSMTTDAAEWWWSSTARSPYPADSTGAICYVDGGARHERGSWPQGDDPFFQGLCDSGA